MTKVAINGAGGKMGRMIADIIEADTSLNMQIVCKREEGAACNEGFDLMIDFSLPEGAREAFALAKKNKAAFLTGTTNLPQDFVEELKAEKEIPVFYSPNVSISVYLFKELIKKAAAYYPAYTKHMHEIHHTQKKDAPSGTAKSLAEAVSFPAEQITYERTGIVPGTHSLVLTSPEGLENITLTHEAVDRKLFAASAVKIAAWLGGRKAGFYDMQDFVEDKK